MKNERWYSFLVEVQNADGTFWPYHEEARSAQEAVDNVRCYVPDDCRVVYVYRQIENWK